MASPKDSMVFYQEWREAVKELSPGQRCGIYEALFDYAFEGKQPTDQLQKVITAMMRLRIDKDQEAYKQKCERNRENIKKRWNKGIRPNTTEYDPIPQDTKNTDNETDNETEFENDLNKSPQNKKEIEGGTPPSPLGAEAPKAPESSEEEKKPQEKPKEKKQATIPFAKIKDLWNELCPSYPKMMVMSDPRKNKIRLRVQEMGGIDKALPTLEKIFKAAENSNFMKGDNKRGWKASFDWIFENDKNWVKVWEGNYENKPKDTHLTTTQNRNYNGTTTKHSTTADSYEARQQWLKDFVEDRLNNPRQEPDIEGNY